MLGLKQGFKSVDGETGDYGSEWNDERAWENRTSLITDPPDGRIPALTPRAIQARAAARNAMLRSWSVEDRPLGERCITYGSPQLTAGYQSYYQIVETPTAVMIMTEMFHDVRIVRMNDGPHPPTNVQGWLGDSIGHWEGDTLVVDTTNYRPGAFQSISSEKLHVIERFTLHDAETLRYEINVNDPNTYTRPWSLMIPLQRSSSRFTSMPAMKAIIPSRAFWPAPAPKKPRSRNQNRLGNEAGERFNGITPSQSVGSYYIGGSDKARERYQER